MRDLSLQLRVAWPGRPRPCRPRRSGEDFVWAEAGAGSEGQRWVIIWAQGLGGGSVLLNGDLAIESQVVASLATSRLHVIYPASALLLPTPGVAPSPSLRPDHHPRSARNTPARGFSARKDGSDSRRRSFSPSAVISVNASALMPYNVHQMTHENRAMYALDQTRTGCGPAILSVPRANPRDSCSGPR